MSTRERWIVYPLLFFALSSGIWPRLLEPAGAPSDIQCRTMECQELRVKTINGRPYVPQPVAIMVPNPVSSSAAAVSPGDENANAQESQDPPTEAPDE